MKRTDFFNEIRDILELGYEVDEETQIHMTSILILSFIALIDEKFNLQVKASDLRKISTVGDIMNLVGLEKFD